jgi:eukaryotic-like serine/threonine-protein kinase
MAQDEHRSPDAEITVAGDRGSSGVPSSSGSPDFNAKSEAFAPGVPVFALGAVLAGRYEILELLGEGGMGAVYKAKDRELDRLVALKTIRAEMAHNAAMLSRFKQEVILAAQITHRNVIRIYDLGEAAGTKFLTMEYIDGEDLRSLLRERGKLAPKEAVAIVEQVCRGLEAAHAEGVIHRDLKPQNIMRDRNGRIVVMDFGLARSFESSLTQTGGLVGTIEYMSPEQAMGSELDPRSDLFALGLIFYELLTGCMPYKSESAISSLVKRSQERAIPVAEIDHTVPGQLSDIVSKCLERDRNLRYQSASELLQELDRWCAGSTVQAVSSTASPMRSSAPALPEATSRVGRVPRKLAYSALASVIAIALIVLIGFLIRRHLSSVRTQGQAAGGPVTSLSILPFRNASGDASLDWIGPSLLEALSTGVGQSKHLRVVSADRVHQEMRDLRIGPDAEFDDATLHRFAEFGNADYLLWGRYSKAGDQIRLDATLQDFKRQRTIPLQVTAANGQLMAAFEQLARDVQNNLSLPAGEIEQLRAVAFQPSTHSIEALRNFTEGLDFERQGNHMEGQKHFEASVKADPDFALAYSKLAQTSAELGHGSEAQQYSRRAIDLSKDLPDREKYLILAAHQRIANDTEKAIATYEKLAEASPEDADLQFALGQLYQQTGAYDKAKESYSRVLQQDPKSVDALLGLGEVETFRLNPQGSVDPLNRALALTIQFGNEERRAKVLQDIAVAYQQLIKPDDALRYAQESLDIRRRLDEKQGIAESLHTIARIQNSLGKTELALKGYQEAIQLQRAIGDTRGLGDTLIDLGNLYNERSDYDSALQAWKESLQIERGFGDQSLEAVDMNNIGGMYVAEGRYDDAQSYYENALRLREQLNVQSDVADTLHNLGDLATFTGQNERALAYYQRALKIRKSLGDERGAAVDNISLAVAYQQRGQYGAALKASSEALQTFRTLQEQGYWLAEVLAAQGSALSQAGREADSQHALDEAIAVARPLKNPDTIAEILNYQGDHAFYFGDIQSARALYGQAVRAAAHKSADPRLVLMSKINLAKASAQDNAPPATLATLNELAQQAETLGLKYLAIEASTDLVEATLRTNTRRDWARQELERNLDDTEKLGFRMLAARTHYLLAKLSRADGRTADAESQMSAAHQILDEMRQESGSDLDKRRDVAAMLQH